MRRQILVFLSLLVLPPLSVLAGESVRSPRPGGDSARLQVPAEREIGLERLPTSPESFRTYLLQRRPILTGRDIVEAGVVADVNTGMPQVQVRLSGTAAKIFEEYTAGHLHRRLAIVVDGLVESAPVIMDRISGGRISISLAMQRSRQDALRDARELTSSLKSGALPAQVEIVSENTFPAGRDGSPGGLELGLRVADTGQRDACLVVLRKRAAYLPVRSDDSAPGPFDWLSALWHERPAAKFFAEGDAGIRVRLTGEFDPDSVRRMLSRPGSLELTPVDDDNRFLENLAGNLPHGIHLDHSNYTGPGSKPANVPYLVVTGTLPEARARLQKLFDRELDR